MKLDKLAKQLGISIENIVHGQVIKYTSKKETLFYNEKTFATERLCYINQFPALCMSTIISTFSINTELQKLNKDSWKIVLDIAAWISKNSYCCPTMIYVTAEYQTDIIRMLKEYGFQEMHTHHNTNSKNDCTFWIYDIK